MQMKKGWIVVLIVAVIAVIVVLVLTKSKSQPAAPTLKPGTAQVGTERRGPPPEIQAKIDEAKRKSDEQTRKRAAEEKAGQ
jgi:hypothetical protein